MHRVCTCEYLINAIPVPHVEKVVSSWIILKIVPLSRVDVIAEASLLTLQALH